MVMPMNMDWNHSPSSGPSSMARSWASISGMTAVRSILASPVVSGILSNLSGMFDGVNEKIGDIAGQVGATPQAWNSSIFNMVHSLSETVILPIAGVMLAFIMTLELIQLIPLLSR